MTEPEPSAAAGVVGPTRALLAATDLSEHARAAALRAAALACGLDARLTLVHVADASDAPARQAAADGLRALAAEIAQRTGLAVEARLETGDPTERVTEAALDAGLLVVGATSRNPLQRLVLGTTAERLLRRSLRPVLVVKRPQAGQPYRRVLVPVDLSAYSRHALALAIRIAPDAQITVLHAYDTADAASARAAGLSAQARLDLTADAHARAVRALAGLLDEFPQAARGRLAASVVRGDVVDAALAAASASDVELIVVGKHQRGALEALFVGSVTRRLLAQADCDLLVVTGATRGAVDAQALPPAYA